MKMQIIGIKSPMDNKLKKKTEKLAISKIAFVDGAVKKGIDQDYAEQFWDNTILGFADYALIAF